MNYKMKVLKMCWENGSVMTYGNVRSSFMDFLYILFQLLYGMSIDYLHKLKTLVHEKYISNFPNAIILKIAENL